MLTLRSDQIGVRDRYEARWRRAIRFIADHGPVEVLRLIRTHGIAASARFVAHNLRYAIAIYINRQFDRRYRVDTAGDIPTEYLEVVGDNKQYGAAFLSSPVRTFEQIMDMVPADLREFTFVDFGAGKGRTLLLASTRDFKRATGVEYAPALVAAAHRNFAAYRNPAQRCRDLSCTCDDAAAYEIPDGPCVLYFLRPFENNVMAAVLSNMKRSYERNPRKLFVIFASPDLPEYAAPLDLLRATGFLQLRTTSLLPWDWGAVYRFRVFIYESVVA